MRDLFAIAKFLLMFLLLCVLCFPVLSFDVMNNDDYVASSKVMRGYGHLPQQF